MQKQLFELCCIKRYSDSLRHLVRVIFIHYLGISCKISRMSRIDQFILNFIRNFKFLSFSYENIVLNSHRKQSCIRIFSLLYTDGYLSQFYTTPYSAIVGHNRRTHHGVTPSSCARRCLQERAFVCRSFDYQVSYNPAIIQLAQSL